jgi:spermidine synthase
VQPWQTIDRAHAPDGTELVLARRGEDWVVRAGGRVLMSSRTHGSEDALAGLALKKAAARQTVLVGGLGLGYTVRATLDRVPIDARVIVAEITKELVAWNRDHVAHLAGRPLDDPRVRLQIGDVVGRITEATKAFDAILLDVDNSPSSFVHAGNDRLYGEKGVRACLNALRPGGVLAVWSAGPDQRYVERLDRAGFSAEQASVLARGSAGERHVIFIGVKPAHARMRPPTPVAARPAQRATGKAPRKAR